MTYYPQGAEANGLLRTEGHRWKSFRLLWHLQLSCSAYLHRRREQTKRLAIRRSERKDRAWLLAQIRRRKL